MRIGYAQESSSGAARLRGAAPLSPRETPMSKLTPTNWIWRDGEFIPWADANVHVLSHSMQFGSSAFEGVRCYSTPRGPAIFRLEDHLQRLVNSCRIY